MISTNAPVHSKASWRRPTYVNASMADPLPFPRPVLLRSSCGHILGAGVVGRRQRFIQWKSCR